MITIFVTEDEQEVEQVRNAPHLMSTLHTARENLRKIWKHSVCPDEFKTPGEAWHEAIQRCYDAFHEALREHGVEL